MSSTMLLVRSSMVEQLRAGLYRELGLAAQQLAEISVIRGGRERDARLCDVYVHAIGCMDAARELLEQIGRQPTYATVRIDIGKYHQPMLAALRRQLDHLVEALTDVLPTQRSEAECRIGELGDYILYLQGLPV